MKILQSLNNTTFFIKTTKLIFVLVIGFETLQGQKNDTSFHNKLGIVSITYKNSFKDNFALTLDTIKNLGIKDIEFSNLFGQSPSEIRKMLDERGMYCSSYGVNDSLLMNRTDEVAKNAKILGAKFVRLAWIPHKDIFTLDIAKKTVEDFNKVGKILKDKYDLSFCYHNHGYEFYPYENGTLFDYIVQHTNPKYISFELDILWAYFGGADPSMLLYKYSNRFKLIHLKDLRKGVAGNLSGGTAIENDVALGTGQINIPSVLKAAQKAGIQHYYFEDESPSYYKQLPESIRYLSEIGY